MSEPTDLELRIFDRVVGLPDEERAHALDEACAGSPDLRARVEALLDADRRGHGLLDVPPGGVLADAARASGPHLQGRRIGPYRIVRELGRGGMGVVYLAERDDVRIHVALKVVPSVGGSGFALARFEQEKRTLARLEHPAIARFLDAGVEPDGVPWMAMEHVEGDRIDTYCHRAGLTLDERLALFEKVAHAVAYAHQRLLVHRDIKPSNVLVTRDGQPKLLDFGIATLLEGSGGEAGTLTREGGRPMTPEYAAPEQLRGERTTTSSDVYQLGLLLHEMLTGRCPSAPGGECLGGLARIASVEPIRPSRLAEARPLRRRLEGDLDTIVLTALRGDPSARYPSAAAMAADVERFRRNRPIEARPATLAYRLRKLFARHKVASSLALALVALAAGSAGALALQARRVVVERDRAQASAAVLQEVLRYADPTAIGRDSLASLTVLGAATARVRRELSNAPETWGPVLVSIGAVYRNRGLPDTAILLWGEAVEALTDAGRRDHASLLEALGAMGAAEVSAGRFAAGLPLLEEAVARARELNRERRVELATSLADLGFGRQVAGDTEVAEALYRDATALLVTLPDSGGEQLDRVLVNRGYVASVRLEDGVAEALFRRAVERRVERLGPTHTRTLNAKSALVRALLGLGRLEEADTLSEEVLEARRRAFGEPHADLADALDIRARVLSARGDVPGALERAREAVAVYTAAVGRESAQAAFAMVQLGDVLARSGRAEEGAVVKQDAVLVYERVFGADHPSTARARVSLADTQLDLGRLDDAEREAERALAAFENRGDEGATLAWPLATYGRVLVERDRCDEARPHLDRALDLVRGTDGNQDIGGMARDALARCDAV